LKQQQQQQQFRKRLSVMKIEIRKATPEEDKKCNKLAFIETQIL
jgi:hypothetical protein